MTRTDTRTRRQFLQVTGAVALGGMVAGCAGVNADADADTDTGAQSTAETAAPTASEEASEGETATAAETDAQEHGHSDEQSTPTNTGAVHYHGHLYFEVDGERVDYDESRFYEETTGNEQFHFHEKTDDDTVWHVHAENVTVDYALNSLPGVTIGDDATVELAGKTYTAEDGATVDVTVDGESVEPTEYVLQRDDVVTVHVETAE